MKERIDIVVPDAEPACNADKQALLDQTRRFEPTERLPIFSHPNQWTPLAHYPAMMEVFRRVGRTMAD